MVKWWATGLAIACLLVGQHISNGANYSFWQLPTQKATSTESSGLAIGHVFGSPPKAMDACVIGPFNCFIGLPGYSGAVVKITIIRVRVRFGVIY